VSVGPATNRGPEAVAASDSGRSVAHEPPEPLERCYSAPMGAPLAVLDRTFFALSDSTRRSVLERLASGPATLGELADPFNLTLNGVKKHVGILETVGLVITAKVGRARQCQLGPANLDDAVGWIDDYRRAWQDRLDRFGAYVEGQ
jgi:DNA-binding transcriptional ArsR family regulator